MTWTVRYHPEVADDMRLLGSAEAARVMGVIEGRIRLGEPDKLGKPLTGDLAGCRRMRAGAIRIVYRVHPRSRSLDSGGRPAARELNSIGERV